MKPFLKWAGGKLRVVDRIKAVLPSGKRLIEPFVGSGAIFLNTEYEEYLLSDANSDLISLYQQLKQGGEQFIDYCCTFFIPENNNDETFYEFRQKFNQSTDESEKAALFIYLNRHCYNGLCRYNGKGKFNVPFGKYSKPYFPKKELHQFYKKAQLAKFVHADFVPVMESAKKGDIVYCDPPYAPLSATAKFTSYSSTNFGLVEQKKLAEMAEILANRGIPVVVSNHCIDLTKKIYKKAHIITFDVQRHISANGVNRIKVPELLAFFSDEFPSETEME